MGLIDGDSSQYRPVGLGIGDVVGYLEKKRKEYLGELWVSLDPVTEAYLVGAYVYFEAKRLEAKRTSRK